jgi:hypothetical protein
VLEDNFEAQRQGEPHQGEGAANNVVLAIQETPLLHV